jgi:hypothetical protein
MDSLAVYGPFITLQQAREQGLTWFWVGQQCKWGHYSEAHVKGGCRLCRQIKARKWQKQNKERATASIRKHQKTEKARLTRERWVEVNKEKLREQYRNKEKRYRAEKTNRAISAAISCRMRAVLRGDAKTSNTLDLLGCDIEAFKRYIEDKWVSGMSWANWTRDGWHIDHIKPCASFDLSDPEQQRECFHYTNMQPLWAKDNLKKADKLSML